MENLVISTSENLGNPNLTNNLQFSTIQKNCKSVSNSSLLLNNNSNSRKRRQLVPVDKKDDGYWNKRKKNNEAARRSREKRRANDLLIEKKLSELQKENIELKQQLYLCQLKLASVGMTLPQIANIHNYCNTGNLGSSPSSSSPISQLTTPYLQNNLMNSLSQVYRFPSNAEIASNQPQVNSHQNQNQNLKIKDIMELLSNLGSTQANQATIQAGLQATNGSNEVGVNRMNPVMIQSAELESPDLVVDVEDEISS